MFVKQAEPAPVPPVDLFPWGQAPPPVIAKRAPRQRPSVRPSPILAFSVTRQCRGCTGKALDIM
jgi:hypothetical protein